MDAHTANISFRIPICAAVRFVVLQRLLVSLVSEMKQVPAYVNGTIPCTNPAEIMHVLSVDV